MHVNEPPAPKSRIKRRLDGTTKRIHSLSSTLEGMADAPTEDVLEARLRTADEAKGSKGSSRSASPGSPSRSRSTSPSGSRLERRSSFSKLDTEDEELRKTLAAEAEARRQAEAKELEKRKVSDGTPRAL